ncbi:hypothetical protein [Allokutzneria albata]|uniref:Uncharacterized protein n=1 Tax=Allokutzneria albata TaxID=211114 RepID=A0A1G9XVV9_ALLAB|nr:hypothetical protein [Allokutzneria albata]SDN00611.1 hypothetical protein SAMN04489726_4424 [Allokutzneria albata]
MVRAAKAVFVGVAVAGLLAVTPLSASAYPTHRYFKSFDACEVEARKIRDGIAGAECKLEVHGWPPKFRWHLHAYN